MEFWGHILLHCDKCQPLGMVSHFINNLKNHYQNINSKIIIDNSKKLPNSDNKIFAFDTGSESEDKLSTNRQNRTKYQLKMV